MGSPIIWAGNAAKLLKNMLNFSVDDVQIAATEGSIEMYGANDASLVSNDGVNSTTYARVEPELFKTDVSDGTSTTNITVTPDSFDLYSDTGATYSEIYSESGAGASIGLYADNGTDSATIDMTTSGGSDIAMTADTVTINGSEAATIGGSQTLTNKTISGASNTINNLNASNLSSGTVGTARLGSGTANSSSFLRGDQTWAIPGAGNLQIVNSTLTGAFSTTAVIPEDNTIPQNTEGAEVLTVTITPNSASSKLLILFTTFCSVSAADDITIALFRDSTADALAAIMVGSSSSQNNYSLPATLSWVVTSGSTSATTFKIRIGKAGFGGGTVRVNASGGVTQYDNTAATSLTVVEI